MDLWGGITLTFNASAFNPGETFQFKIDTDGFTAASVDTPEPGSVGLASIGLALLAARKYFLPKS